MKQSQKAAQRAAGILVGSLATLMALPAVANDGGLEEVVVTARKREENLQNVSMSISAIPASEIEKLGISDVSQVAKLDSSLIYDKGYSATDNRIQIRGLSPTRGRVNVAVLVDGIDTSSESISFGGGSLLATNKLLDLQAIEIVKGPQSALYGRSAFAGAVQYVTKDPSREFEGDMRAAFGQYGRYELGSSLSGPVNDSFGLRFNGVYWNDDGHYKNSITGKHVGNGDGWGAGITVKWTGDGVTVKTRLEYTDDHFGQAPIAQMPVNSIVARPTVGSTCLTIGSGVAVPGSTCPAGTARVYAASSPFFVGPGSNHVYSSLGTVPEADALAVKFDVNPATGKDYPGSDRQILRGSMIVNWDALNGTVTSLTGYTDASFAFLEDGDYDSGVVNGVDKALRAAVFDNSNKTKQFSEELRYRSDFEGPLNFMAGYLYWQEKAEQTTRSINVLCIPPLPANVGFGPFPLPASCGKLSANQVMGQTTTIPRLNAREIKHNSFFGMLEYEFNPQWKASIEGRYAKERETVVGVNCSSSLNAAAYPGGPVAKCQDPTVPGFQVFGPSIVYVYPFVNLTNPFGAALGPQQAPGTPVSLESQHQYFAPRATLEYRANDDALIYLTWAKGVKPGGISTVTAGSWQDADYDGLYDEFSFKDEKIQEYELGAKLTTLDGRLRFNPSLFLIKYDDKQVGAQLVTPSGILVGRLLNAGKAEVKGFELDSQWAATDHWLFGVNYSYLDTKFTDFPFSSTSSTDAVRVGSCERRFDTLANAKLCFFNLKGRELERAPKSSLVAQARWSTPIGAGEGMKFYIEGDVQVQSSRFLDYYNTVKLDAYTEGSVRIGVTSPKWDALVYIDNVGNDKTVQTGNANPGDVAQSLYDPTNFSPANTVGVRLPDPRVVGVRFTYRFR